MRIKRLHIENFRCFQNIDIDFHLYQDDTKSISQKLGGLTVFVAQNAEGKTTVLDAINIAIGPFLTKLTKVKDRFVFLYEDNHRNQNGTIQGAAKIDATLLNPESFIQKLGYVDFHVVRLYDGLSKSEKSSIFAQSVLGNPPLGCHDSADKTKTYDHYHLKNLAKYIFDWENNGAPWPLVAYYGDQRMGGQLSHKYDSIPMLAQDRLAGYRDARKPAISYERCLSWMKELDLALFGEQKKKESEDPSYNPETFKKLQCFMSCMKDALHKIMAPSGYTDFDFNVSKNEFEVWGKQHPVRIVTSRLSAGIRVVIGMVSDMVYRCCLLNPQLEEEILQKTPGIVLVDEIELHLHPAWQQTILPTMQEVFPNIQFIVTTHSPQVVSSVPKECIRVISDGQIVPLSTPTQGVEVGDILAGIFGTDPIPQNSEIAQKLNRLHALLTEGNGDTLEWKNLYQELEQYYGEDYPPLLGAKSHRDFLKKMQAGVHNA